MTETPNNKNPAAPAGSDAASPSVLDNLTIKDELSAEELDTFIEQADPEFYGSVKKVAADQSLSLSMIDYNDEEAALHAEIDYWQSRTGFLRVLYRLLPLMPKATLKYKKIKATISDKLLAAWIRSKNFVLYVMIDGRKLAINYAKAKYEKLSEDYRYNKNQFERLSFKLRVSFYAVLVLILVSVVMAYISLTRGILPQQTEMFINSIEAVASQKFELSDTDETENFYENLRASQNVILIEKMVVNIKRSQSSGPNPMAAFEFFVEGSNSDVVVEIKDRETMFRDAMMRTLEGFDFDTLESASGKRDMADSLQKRLNELLTTGHVKSIMIKTVIIKP